LKTLGERTSSFVDREDKKLSRNGSQETITAHRGTRASSNSQFHISPHPGFLSQLRLPLTREIHHHNQQLNDRHRQEQKERSQSPISSTPSGTLSSSKPSLLSQSFRRSNGPNQSLSSSSSGPVLHGVSSTSPRLTNKLNQHPESFHEEESFEASEEEGVYDSHQTPPNAARTWRTVHSKTPPTHPSFRLQRYSEEKRGEMKESGRLVHDDLIFNETTHSPAQLPPGHSLSSPSTTNVHSARFNKEHRLYEKNTSSRPLRTGSKSKASSSPTLREMMESDRERTQAAKVPYRLPSLLISV
jgi:hypothetical protein